MAKSSYFVFLSLLLLRHAVTGQTAVPEKKLDSLKQGNNLAEWLYTRVDYSYNAPKETLPFLLATEKQLWRKPQSLSEKEAWLILLSNLGYNQLYSGDILASINSYEKAYNYSVSNRLNTDITDYVLKPWANNYTRLGDYEKALFIQQKILDFALRDRAYEQVASAYNNMAVSYRSVGDFGKAEKSIVLGLKNSKPQGAMVILLNNTLADIQKDKGDLNLANKTVLENISRQQQHTPDFETAYWLMSSYTTAGDIAFGQKRYAAALKYYQQSLKINERYYKGNRMREKAYLITQLGRISIAENKPLEALKLFDQNLHAFGVMNNSGRIREDRIFGDNRIIEVFYQKAVACLKLDREDEALDNMLWSLRSADKIRFELADVKTRQRFQAESKQRSEEAIAIAFSLLQKTGKYRYALTIGSIAEQSKARTLLDEIRRNQQRITLRNKDTLYAYRQILEKAIAYNEKEGLQHPGQASCPVTRNADLKFKMESVDKLLREKYPAAGNGLWAQEPLDQILKRLPPGIRLVEYFFGAKDIYAIVISNGKLTNIHKIENALLVRKSIAAFSQTYYHHGPQAMMNEPKQFFKAAHSIYEKVVAGLELKKKERVVIIPDEELGYLSFDGLLTDSNYTSSISAWPFLIKKLSMSYAFSLSTLVSQSVSRSHANGFTGFFISHQGADKQYIPAVEKEAEAIESAVSGRFFMDKAAKVNAFYEAFEQSAVLHIGTHAYLSGAQQEPTLALDDDQIFLFELSAGQHAPALVMLSACRTADGMMAAGEGIISLSRGFAAIGTQGTIAGLWNVNDDAASAITASCYAHLLDQTPVSEALHLAKLDWLLNKRNAELEYLPYYWDALIYMGYDQKIALTPAHKGYSIWIISAILLGLLGFIIWFASRLKRPAEVH